MWYSSLVILSSYGFSQTLAEMSQDLEFDGNVTEQRSHAMDLFKFDLHHTGLPLAICTTVLLVALIKPLILKVRFLPPSIILLILGFVLAYILKQIPQMPPILRFHPELFFCIYLPFIVADAGWFLPMKEFFHNILHICYYACIGTVFNAILVVIFLKLVSAAFWTPDISNLSLFAFSVIISAVDPVAVISVFEDVQVNERLNIIVFGESLLNDGVVIVLYQSINNMLIVGESNLGLKHYLFILPSFLIVVGFGIFFGMVFGFIGTLMQRWCVVHQALMPTITIVVPYMSYLTADTFGFSGLVAIMTCCIIMKNFASGNVCLEMQYTAEFIFKNLGSYSESFIFILLGYSSANFIQSGIDWPFLTLALVGVIAIRFIVVFSLTAITNACAKFREDRISWRDQFIMAYGGLRGAVCYGLVASIDPQILGEKELYLNATVFIVLFTTIIQGSTIRCFVSCLDVKRKEEHEIRKSTLQHAMHLTTKHLNSFLEDLTLSHEENRVFRGVRLLDGKFRNYLCHYQKPRGVALLEDQMEEETFYKKGRSFAGLPTDHSLASMHLPTSKSAVFHAGYNETALLPPCRPVLKPSVPRQVLPPSSPIPRNESVSDIIPNIFQTDDLERVSTKHKRKSIYNRHMLGYVAPLDPSVQFSTDRPDEDDADDSACQMTFPYAKSLNQKMFAQQARNISKSVRDKDGHLRTLSPQRAMTARANDSPYKTYHASTSRSSAKTPFIPPTFTITDEENSPSPPTANKPGRAKNERKITTGTKTFVVGAEDENLMPIEEDEDTV